MTHETHFRRNLIVKLIAIGAIALMSYFGKGEHNSSAKLYSGKAYVHLSPSE